MSDDSEFLHAQCNVYPCACNPVISSSLYDFAPLLTLTLTNAESGPEWSVDSPALTGEACPLELFIVSLQDEAAWNAIKKTQWPP